MQEAITWAGSRVLVTGGTGFIGSHLCRRLIDYGSRVHATSRSAKSSARVGLEWHNCSLARAGEARRLLQEIRPQVIFHLAGTVTAAPRRELVLTTFRSLLSSTVNVLDSAADVGCERVVLVGSFTEPSAGPEAVPQSPYAAAKLAMTAYGRLFHARFGVPVVIVRPYMVYGPAQASTKLVPSTILSVLKGERPRVSSGEQKFDWVYIDDIVEGFLRCAASHKTLGMTIDLGSGTLVSVKDIVNRIVQLMNYKRGAAFGAEPSRPGEIEVSADVSRAQSLLDWRAATPLEEGLRRTIDWYRSSLDVQLGKTPV